MAPPMKRTLEHEQPCGKRQKRGDDLCRTPRDQKRKPCRFTSKAHPYHVVSPVTRPESAGVWEKLGDNSPLRMLIIGHNPSDHAWSSGHSFSHPCNRMWPILKKTGIAPPIIRGCEDDAELPAAAGVGITSVGLGCPGTHSHKFTAEVFALWKSAFYARLQNHLQAACASIGCTCGLCGAPSIVAFAGKRQFLEIYNVGMCGKERLATVGVGPQAARPADWPLPTSTEVWVMTSTSGASALTNEQREAPWRALSERLRQLPWPSSRTPRCQEAPAAQS